MENTLKKTSAIKSRLEKYSKQEKIVLPIFHFLLLFFAIWAILPIVFVILNSLKQVDDYYASPMNLPKTIMWVNFSNALKITYRNTNVYGMLFNTVVFVVTFSLANILSSLFMAYALSRFNFKGKNFLYALAVVVQIIPIFGTTGAAYILQSNLGILDNIWLSWITAASGFDYAFLIVFSYLVNVDRAYSESAEIDGAGNFRIMFTIITPMVLPAMLVMWLSSVVGLWNNYTSPLIYWPNHPTLSTGLYNLKSLASYIEGGTTTYFSAIVLSIIPISLIFLITQKWIFNIKVDGGIKG